MNARPDPWSPPASLGELVGDPLNGVADVAVQSAFGRVWSPPPDDGPPDRRAARVTRSAIREVLEGGELRRARIVGVRETPRSVQFGSSTGDWQCPVWQLGLDVDGITERVGCNVAVSPAQPPVKVGDVVQVRCDPHLTIVIIDRIASGWDHEVPAHEVHAAKPADPPPTGYTSEIWEDSTGRRGIGAVLGCLGAAAIIVLVSVFLPTPFNWVGFGFALLTAACVIPVLTLSRGTRRRADDTWPTVIAAVTGVGVSNVLVNGRNPVTLGLRLFPLEGAPVDIRIDDFVPRDGADLLRPGIALPVRTRNPAAADAEVQWMPFLIAHGRR